MLLHRSTFALMPCLLVATLAAQTAAPPAHTTQWKAAPVAAAPAKLADVPTAPQPLYLDPKAAPAERARDLVGRMTLDERASQLEDWAPSIPRLGVPDYQTWNESLHGVARAGYATVFPQAIGMAATWDPSAIETMGGVISSEGRAKYNQAQAEGNRGIFFGLTYWSPNINIFRDPRWGRGQETYGEDPYLTGKLGVAFIHGVQGADPKHPRAVATAKHFAVHSGPEQLRHGFNVNVAPRDLEETYLPAFRAAVIDGQVASVMCAYNAIDTWPACTNKALLKDHLREAWGFKGFVVSDCGAIVDVNKGHKKTDDIVHAAALSLEEGTDLSCSIWTPGFNTLGEAVRKGLTSEALVTQAAERLFTARFALGLFDPVGWSSLDATHAPDALIARNRTIARHAAEESIVLLKNSGVLPLRGKPGKIAVIGPTADLLPSLMGNYQGTPLHPVTPLDGMKTQFGAGAVVYAQGSVLATGMGVPVPRTAFGPGLKTEYFASPDWTGRPQATLLEPLVQTDWETALPVPQIATPNYSVRWSGAITVPAAGHYTFTVEAGDSFPYSPTESYRVLFDGKVVSEGNLRKVSADPKPAAGASPTAPRPMDSPLKPSFTFDFADTNAHQFVFEYAHSGERAGGGVTLRWDAPAQAQIDEAVARAKDSDVVVAFVGLSPQLEGEEMPIKIDGFDGGDRTSLDLPAPQQKLLEALGATGKPLVVVLESGSAVSLNWAKEHAQAILEAWYPGVEGGSAIARTLAGASNPAGRLPITFYASLDGLPAFTDYALKGRTYRYFTGKPLWGFGYGLSYTTFKYDEVKLSAESIKAGDPLTATVTLSNTGNQMGDEVVEAYLKTPQKDGPVRTLVGFERVNLAPGSKKQVKLLLDPRSLSSVDEAGNRAILPGKYTLTVAGAQPDEAASHAEAEFTVEGTQTLLK